VARGDRRGGGGAAPPAGVSAAAALRRRSAGAYIANNELDAELAEKLLADGEADLVSFGRAFLANPDLVGRIRSGAAIAEAPRRYWYGGGEVGYSDWPARS
jgi:N-ethylmaleimide reductase